jgi:hypothetical protein
MAPPFLEIFQVYNIKKKMFSIESGIGISKDIPGPGQPHIHYSSLFNGFTKSNVWRLINKMRWLQTAVTSID